MFEGIIYSSIVPALIVAAAWLAAAIFNLSIKTILRTLILPTAFIFGFLKLTSRPPFPPNGSHESWFYLILLSPVLMVFHGTKLFKKLVLFFLCFVAAVALLKSFVFNSWDAAQTAQVVGILGVFGFALFEILERSEKTMSAVAYPFLAMLTVMSLSFFCVASGSALVGQLAGTFCASLGGLIFVRLFFSKISGRGEELAYIFISVFSLILLAHFYLDVTWLDLGILIYPLSFYALWRLLPFKPKRTWGEMAYLALLSSPSLAYSIYKLWVDLSSGY